MALFDDIFMNLKSSEASTVYDTSITVNLVYYIIYNTLQFR